MLLSFAYLAFAALLRLLAAGRRDPFAREVELLALRHELAVLRRHSDRPRLRPADRASSPPWRGCCRLTVAAGCS